MTTIFARHLLTSEGWLGNQILTVADGRIAAIDDAADSCECDVNVGVVMPGIANAHSHAFQRALVGHTEHRCENQNDSFWTWRTSMYALANTLSPEHYNAIAAQLYVEMLQSGYTSVAEFHYLHNATTGHGIDGSMSGALVDAAQEAGIRFTYVPVLYERAGFDAATTSNEQRRFQSSADELLDHYADFSTQPERAISKALGAHSLRAVSASLLAELSEVAANDNVPFHLHIAEQWAEVEQSLAAYGARPVRWLLDNADVNDRWCLVHATHVDNDECQQLAATGAVVCLCPSTEANLGDGLFPLAAYLQSGGTIAIGSDSHVSVNPFEELRWLEYGQRLAHEQRNVAAIRYTHTGHGLFEATTNGGAIACGSAAHALTVDAPADLVCFDDDSAVLAGHGPATFIDALVFSGSPLPVDRVMVNGQWQVVNGVHRCAEAVLNRFQKVIREIDLARSE